MATKADPRELKTASPFKDLFAIKPETLKAVTERMKADGYHPGHPIEIWLEKNLVIDGHTRLQAAMKAKLKDVLVTFVSFPDEDSALDHAIKNQRERRNLTSAEIAACVLAVDERRKVGRKGVQECLSRDKHSDHSHVETARKVGVSPATVSRVRAVADARDEVPEAYDDMMSGKASIKEAARRVSEVKAKTKPRKPKPEPPPEPVEPEPPPEPEPEPVAVALEKPAALFGSPIGHDATAALAKIDALIARYLDELGDSDRILFIAGLMERVDALRIEYEVTSTEVTIEL